MSEATKPLPRVGVSACLLGERVRYDAGHRLATSLIERLGAHVEWVPVCPEVEAGFGVPRPPMRLERAMNAVRLVEIESGRDHTLRMRDYAARRVEQLLALPICGYVLKTRSPSCGVHSVPVTEGGDARPLARGLFAAALIAARAELPVADDEELADPQRCAAFLARVAAYAAAGDAGA